MEQLRRLPIGIQSFTDMRVGDYIYVDKTQFVAELIRGSKQYFLSRPRRFGKSLFISTLEEYFLGRRELFCGLALERFEPELARMQKRDEWVERPVFHLDLSGQIYTEKNSLITLLVRQLCTWEKNFGITENEVFSPADRFSVLIRTAYEKTGRQVVVLIDEYDKPLLDNIDNDELMDTYRKILKGFYGVLKPMDRYLHFVFITGITRFDKVSIFSDLNQLNDISVDERFASICGVTQEELERNFVPEIEVMAQKNKVSYVKCLERLKRKYDGYHFVYESEGIYNPFSLINALYKRRFGEYWFATGTPTFLVKMLADMHIDTERFAGGIEVDGRTFESYHIDTRTPEPLLYQAGYLTIKNYDDRMRLYTLGFPNGEVEYGFLFMLIPFYLKEIEAQNKFEVWKFCEEVRCGDVDGFMRRIQAIFAAIPQKTSEKYYELDGKQIFFLIFKLMGEFIQCEVQNGDGRSDAVVWAGDTIYVFEFKLDGTAGEALEQINGKNYAIAYQSDGRQVVKVGAVFSSTECNVTEWEVQR